MDNSDYRSRPVEQARIKSLMELLPSRGPRVLDVGARDGYVSKLLAERFDEVVALDVQCPVIDHARVRPVKGDVTALDFPEGYFDATLCAEVLEHIPPRLLPVACREIMRVSAGAIVVGVSISTGSALRKERRADHVEGAIHPGVMSTASMRRIWSNSLSRRCWMSSTLSEPPGNGPTPYPRRFLIWPVIPMGHTIRRSPASTAATLLALRDSEIWRRRSPLASRSYCSPCK